MRLVIHKPKLEELWFRKQMLEDEVTMSYNKAWGGTISFPKEDWEDWYNHWVVNTENKRYYRYLQNEEGDFVGEIAYHYDTKYQGYVTNIIIYAKYRKQGYGSLGLEMLCDIAKSNGVSSLYDDIAIDNPGISIFKKLGFMEEYRTNEIILLKKEL